MSADPETGERQVKASGRFYATIIAQGGVSDELYEKYVAEQEYDVR